VRKKKEGEAEIFWRERESVGRRKAKIPQQTNRPRNERRQEGNFAAKGQGRKGRAVLVSEQGDLWILSYFVSQLCQNQSIKSDWSTPLSSS